MHSSLSRTVSNSVMVMIGTVFVLMAVLIASSMLVSAQPDFSLVTPISISLAQECYDARSSRCTLVYHIIDQIPIESIKDLRALSSFFPQSLYFPGKASSLVGVDSFENRYSLCHEFKKSFQPDPIPIDSNLHSTIEFLSEYFATQTKQITATFNPSLIIYTDPLTITYPFDCNNEHVFSCVVRVESIYTGPSVTIQFQIPYSARVETYQCTSHMSWTNGHIVLPGNNLGLSVPHPDDLTLPVGITKHRCDLWVKKNYNVDYPLSTIHISTYGELNSKQISRFTTPETSKQVPAAAAFTKFPFSVTSSANCLEATSQLCTYTIQQFIDPSIATQSNNYLRTFSFSLPRITDQIRPVGQGFSLKFPNSTPSSLTLTPPTIALTSTAPNPDSSSQDGDVAVFTITMPENFAEAMQLEFEKTVIKNYAGPLLLMRSYSGFVFPPVDVFLPNYDGNSPILHFYPNLGVTLNQNCRDPTRLDCTVIFTRSSLSIRAMYFYFDLSIIEANGKAVIAFTTFPVRHGLTFSQTATAYAYVFPSYLPLLSFPVVFSKPAGSTLLYEVTVFNIDETTVPDQFFDPQVTDPDLRSNLPVDWTYPEIKATSTALFSSELVFQQDAYPVFASNCHDTGSQFCTATYHIISPATTAGFGLNPAALPAPLTLIKHVIPPLAFIMDAKFIPSQMFTPPGSSDSFPLCHGDLRDASPFGYPSGLSKTARFAVNHVSSDFSFQGAPAGTIELILTAGAIYGDVTCQIQFYKKYQTLNEFSGRFRALPLVLFGQQLAFFRPGNSVKSITFPTVRFVQFTVEALDDRCLTQTSTNVFCVLRSVIYASMETPLKKLELSELPSALIHPLIKPSVYSLYSSPPTADDAWNRANLVEVAYLDINYRDNTLRTFCRIPPPFQDPWDSDYPGHFGPDYALPNDGNDCSNYGPGAVSPYSLSLNDDDSDSDSDLVSFRSTDSQLTNTDNSRQNFIPVSSYMFEPQQLAPSRWLRMYINPQFRRTPSVAYWALKSDPIRGSVPFLSFVVAFPIVNGLLQVKSMLSLAFPTTLTGVLMTLGTNSVNARSTRNTIRAEYTFNYGSAVGAEFRQVLIDSDFKFENGTLYPCVEKTSSDGYFTADQVLSLSTSSSNPDAFTSPPANVMGWFSSDSTTGQTLFRLTSPTTTTGKTCYIFITITSTMVTENVRHTILAGSRSVDGSFYYFQSYPHYYSSGEIIPIDSEAETSSAFITPFFILSTLTITLLSCIF